MSLTSGNPYFRWVRKGIEADLWLSEVKVTGFGAFDYFVGRQVETVIRGHVLNYWKWDKIAEVEESGRIRQSVVFRSHVEVNLVPIFSSSKIWKESRYQVVIESRRIWFNHFYWFKEMLLMQIIESVLIGSIHSCFDYWLITAVLVIQSWNITQCGSVTFVKSLIHFRVTEKKRMLKMWLVSFSGGVVFEQVFHCLLELLHFLVN